MYSGERHEEEERTRRLLHDLVLRSVMTQKSIAKRIGLSKGNMSDLLVEPPPGESGGSMQFSRVLEILDVIGIEPKAFFAALYGSDVVYQPGGDAHRLGITERPE